MKKPVRRTDIPPRNSDNNKRRLAADVTPAVIERLIATVNYEGSPKHKRNPHLFALEPYNGARGDATLCDDHAQFQPQDIARIPDLILRGLSAGLIGTNLWTVDDGGWIYEARLTNVDQAQYHAYPVRPGEAIAQPVYQRFNQWAQAHGSAADKQAAQNCADLYGF
jgi:hypothetical protein